MLCYQFVNTQPFVFRCHAAMSGLVDYGSSDEEDADEVGEQSQLASEVRLHNSRQQMIITDCIDLRFPCKPRLLD